jgi:hypothetical protein
MNILDYPTLGCRELNIGFIGGISEDAWTDEKIRTSTCESHVAKRGAAVESIIFDEGNRCRDLDRLDA